MKDRIRGEPRNVVFLIAAIQAFIVSFPSLVLSVTMASAFCRLIGMMRQGS